MATPIIVKPTRPAEIIVGKGETAGSPIFVPSTGGGGESGGGSSVALEELFGLPESVPSLVIGSDTDIYRSLQDIVPIMDLSLSTEQAREFTTKTQTLVGKDTSIGESREQGNGSELEQFFGVVEPKDCQWMTQDEVCNYLEQIMQTIDPELTASMAQSITQSTTAI